ncbi:MAG TPA: hypothetical protein VEG33_19400, partial [Streptosporangiaceae bacterium]|nr:hypothetical protein [Streptosporangiaceae bacterium]
EPVTEPTVTEPTVREPAITQEQRRRGAGARRALTSRGAGWVAAAILAGAVVALSVVLATSSSTTVLQPAGAAWSFRFVPAGGGAEIVALPPNALPTSWVQIRPGVPPGGVRVEVPVVVRPAGGPAQARAGRWVQVPARVWVQVPAGVVAPVPTASPAKSSAP